jgi:membrane-associated protease RseP (regulator of RpoE activity)
MADLQDPNPWTAVEQQYRPPEVYVYPPPAPPRPKYWLHILLYILTIITTTAVGGWAFSAALLSILTAHEFGHYFTAKFHGVPASLPYFIPLPLPPFGTMGAVIKMSPRIPNRRVLFDIAAAGPLAGLIVALPITYVGLHFSTVMRISDIPKGLLQFSDPLLFKAITWLVFGKLGSEMELIAHPVAFAGWAGMFVTALNLLPIGQLDGGHISHAIFGSKSRVVAMTLFAGLLGFSVLEKQYTWVPLLVFLLIFGIQHPRMYDDQRPLGTGRVALGALLGVVFVTCFSLIPINI